MPKTQQTRDKTVQLRVRLLDWYNNNRRDLPWRQSADPYAIWVSEIMLQQTRVAVVVERYKAFMERWPTLNALALASEQEVLALWSGLGYYRRARMLHRAAQVVVAERHGELPESAAELRQLPGIGAYTSAAIASIAHSEPVAVVDGNVERVLCRFAGWEASSGGGAVARKRIEALAAQMVDPKYPGDFNQAMMELGATVCTPRNPHCDQCPWTTACVTRGEHPVASRPKMTSRAVGYALVLRNGLEVLLEQRGAAHTVMPGLWELPSLLDPVVPEADLRMTVRHAIMQVNYSVRVRTVCEDEVASLTAPGGYRRWVTVADAGPMALTGLTRKILTRAQLLGPADLRARPHLEW